MKIEINTDTCIKCGKCVKVCPSKIFIQSESSSPICTEHADNCIVCGHCVAVCPTSSIDHAQFTAQTIHKIDYSAMPTPEQMMLLCKVRRSNRAFSARPIDADTLDLILEAAHRAPTASNQQLVEYTLITDPVRLREISDYTVNIFSSLVRRLENPLLSWLLKPILPSVYKYLPSFHRLIQERAKGNDLILRGATAVIFIHAPSSSRFGCQDANLAYQNGSLMAESLGISQFYTGFVCTAIKQDKRDALALSLGINGTIHAGMALGIPAFRYPNYIDRKQIKVNKI